MKDNSFLYFTKDEVIEKIDIDPRLVDSFKRVMIKLQEYFDANDYTLDRNYKEYIKRFLIDSGNENLRLYINSLDNPNVGGFYSRDNNEICINENRLEKSKDSLDATMCHEFIHFLVMHRLVKEKSESSIRNGGFVNEALTEMLTQQMYHNSRAYDAQVAMQKYANLLSGKVNNYKMFLNGYIDSRYPSHDWENYMSAVNRFQDDFNKKGYINLCEAQNNENFISAQRRLISLFIRPNNDKTFDEYLSCIEKILDRPVDDLEYVNSVIDTLDNSLIRGMRLNKPLYVSILKDKLSEVRELLLKSREYDGKDIYWFELLDRKIGIDKNFNFYGDLNKVVRSWDPKERKFTISLDGEKVELNVDTINYSETKDYIQQRINQISKYFSKTSERDLMMINSINQDFIRLERFSLPKMGNKRKSPTNIYVLVCKNKLMILNNCVQIGIINNIDINEFIGMTSNNPKEALIYARKIANIGMGTTFSILTPLFLNNLAISEFSDTLPLDEIDLEKLISEYGVDISLYDDLDELKSEVIKMYAKNKFDKLSQAEKQSFIDKVVSKHEKFVVSNYDGNIDVSLLFGDEYVCAYQAKREVLLDKNGYGLYNQFYEELLLQNNIDEVKQR